MSGLEISLVAICCGIVGFYEWKIRGWLVGYCETLSDLRYLAGKFEMTKAELDAYKQRYRWQSIHMLDRSVDAEYLVRQGEEVRQYRWLHRLARWQTCGPEQLLVLHDDVCGFPSHFMHVPKPPNPNEPTS